MKLISRHNNTWAAVCLLLLTFSTSSLVVVNGQDDTTGTTPAVTTATDESENVAFGSVPPRPDNATAPAAAPVVVPQCTSSEDCTDGTDFCGSDGNCHAFTCEKWANYTPSGVDVFMESGAPCEEERTFCGTDGICHDYSCEEWYTFGPVAWTGYDPSNPVELSCSDCTDCQDKFLNGIVHGCKNFRPGNRAPSDRFWTYYFDEQCTATPRDGHDFECYQIKPTTSFNDYLGEVSRINVDSCNRDLYDIEQPLYHYNIAFDQVRQGETTRLQQAADPTGSFNPKEGYKAMYAKVVSDKPVPTDDGPPPETSPDASSATSSWNGGSMMMMMVMMMASFILAAMPFFLV